MEWELEEDVGTWSEDIKIHSYGDGNDPVGGGAGGRAGCRCDVLK